MATVVRSAQQKDNLCGPFWAARLLGADEEAFGSVPADVPRLAHHADGGFALQPDAFAELVALSERKSALAAR